MAVIKSDRPACEPYLNRPAKFLREVAKGDPAFNAKVPQVVVEIDGKEVYFFANEVSRDDEKPAAPPPRLVEKSADKKPAVEKPEPTDPAA